MRIDERIEALRAPDAPEALLRESVAHADELAPQVFAAADKLCEGIYLLPGDRQLLFHGLHILAAARHPELYARLIAISRLSERELDDFFPLHAPISLKRLMLSVWDGEADPLFAMIEDPEISDQTKWALFGVIARLTFDGRIPRQTTSAFLARCAFDEGDALWWGWEEAVSSLGLTDLEPMLRDVITKSTFEIYEVRDKEQCFANLKRAAANPDKPDVLDGNESRPIDDPAEAVSWRHKRKALLAQINEEADTALGDDDEARDPAATQRLTQEELDWLHGFMSSPQVPPETMSFEMLDGYLTALVIGPETVNPSEFLPLIWGDDQEEPVWDSNEQAQYCLDLILKHWNAIAIRRMAYAQHDPYIEPRFGDIEGSEWSQGFLVGVHARQAAWEPIFKDPDFGPYAAAILLLAGDDDNLLDELPSSREREAVLETLPQILQLIAGYWLKSPRSFPRNEPARSTKVGRNQPCPCGSGKKYKKCCGTD